MNKNQFKITLLFLPLVFLNFNLSAQTTIEKSGDDWELLVDGNPFEVKGATFGYDKEVADLNTYFQDLNFLGVNTIRTWGTDKNTEALLDVANQYGIKVMLGIWMRHGRPGMESDDRFDYLNDTEGMQAMYKSAIETVEKYKDHPAILTWGIGNEVYLNIATDEEKLAYSKLLESICSEIKKIDKSHPITSVEAWTFGVDWWHKYVPSIDIYGINTYGAGANILPEELQKKGVDKPYIITEFGVRGEWEIEEDKNGVKPEPSDKEKYETIVNGYNNWIKNKPNCLGLYVFHYASDHHFMAPWLLTHFDGMKRPQYWAIREAYTGQKPQNYVPIIQSFHLPDTKSKSGTWIPVKLEVFDKEQEELDFHFYYNQRTGSRIRRDQLTALNFRGSLSQGYEVQLPPEQSGIKVYVTVSDSYSNVGIASTSISVVDEQAQKRRFLVPKVDLPFYVYQDNTDLPYAPSAYMGNYQAIEVDLNHTEIVKSGKTAIKIRYNDKSNWYGIGLVDPPGDWGDILGGYDISDAKTFSFWAKGSYDNLKAKIGFGLIEDNQPFPDSAKKLIELSLTKEWKKYTIKTKDMDLSCIRSGLVIFSSGEGLTHDIYIDDVVFE